MESCEYNATVILMQRTIVLNSGKKLTSQKFSLIAMLEKNDMSEIVEQK